MKRNRHNRRSVEDSDNNKNEHLRGEIRKLRKEVQILRKENFKLRGREAEFSDLLEDTQVLDDNPYCGPKSCPLCGSKHIRIIEKLKNDTDYYICNNEACNSRGPYK